MVHFLSFNFWLFAVYLEGRDRAPVPTGSFQSAAAVKVWARPKENQEFHLALWNRWGGPKSLGWHLLPRRLCLRRKLGRSRAAGTRTKPSNKGCGCVLGGDLALVPTSSPHPCPFLTSSNGSIVLICYSHLLRVSESSVGLKNSIRSCWHLHLDFGDSVRSPAWTLEKVTSYS